MAVTKLVRPQIPVTQVGPPTPHIPKMMTMIAHGTTSATPHLLRKKNSGSRFGDFSSGFRPIRVSDQSSIFINGEEEEEEEEAATDPRTISQIKAHLYESLQGINRGIFGAPSEKKSEIEALVNALESRNPLPEPTLSLDKVAGCWRLVYSTITILGPKRTKLGLRDFISLGDFLQFINLPEEKAVNVVMFNVRGLNLFNGQLRIEASFRIASKSRVEIQYDKSTITPDQLMNVFRKNYNMLLEIFNPEGWLEITYVDDTLRIGRDDKGNIFVLERHQVP